MKKTLLVILAFVTLTLTNRANAEFRYGPTAGVNFTTLNFNQDLFKVDGTTGFNAGVMGEMMFPGIGFGVDMAFTYSQQGARLHLGDRPVWGLEGYTDPRCTLHYISIPLDLRFKWTRMNGLEEHIAPYVFGGPTFNFLAAHSSVKALGYAGVELGLQCGLGFEIKKKWQIQGSYTWGMTYAVETKLLDDLSADNRMWQVRVTYLF